MLPHVIDVDEAMKPDAPLLFDDLITRGVEPPPKPSNISKRVEYKLGDLAAGFAAADEIVEMSFKTAPVHQAYIEPQGCVARCDADGQGELWSSSQGHFVVRAYTTQLLGMTLADLRVYPAEIGGAFGGKTVIYVEPVCVMLAKKSGHPVKLVMSREDVFRATGPTSGSSMTVKIGVKRDGKIVAADGLFKLQAGAFPGSPFMSTCMCAFAPYDIPNARAIGYDVVSNRPKVAAYRAPGSPMGAYAVESVLDVLAQKIGMDPLELRLKNAARKGTQMLSGGKLGHDGYAETIEALIDHPGYRAPLGKNQGRGVASGYWFNGGGEFERHRARQRGRHGRAGDREPRHRRLARLDGDHGGRDARHRLRPGAPDHRRHRLGRLHARHRRLARHLRDRRRGGRHHQEDHRRAVRAGGQDVEGRPGGRGVGGRPRQAGEQQCRRVRAAVAQGDRRQERDHRRADRRRRRRSTRPWWRPASPPSSATSRSIRRPAR